MGFKTGDFPPVDTETFLDKPLLERTKALALHWVEYGFGSPKMIPATYVVKLVVLYLFLGAVLITTTSDVGAFWEVSRWWDEPIVYQKFVLWTVLLEAVGVAGSWGPMAGKFKPMTGGALFWARPGTIRLRPWKVVPFTNGDTRTVADVALYLGFLGTLLAAILLPGQSTDSLTAALPQNTSGLIDPPLMIAPIVLLVLCGLRDKTIFLAARSEQYLPAMVFFASSAATSRTWCRRWSRTARARRAGGSGARTTGTSPATSVPPSSPPSWRTSAGPPSRSRRRWSCCSRGTTR